MLVNIGLILIILGWAVQLRGKGREMKDSFLVLYILGVVLLAINGFMGEISTSSILQLISSLTALGVFLKVRK